MYALSIDTTSAVLCLGLADYQEAELDNSSPASSVGHYRLQTWDLGRDLSRALQQHLSHFLAPQSWSQLSWLAVAHGPGSYTGTRMGVVTARILAQQLEIPLYGLSSLEAMASAYATWSLADTPGLIAVEMPAQRGSIYGGLYQWPPKGWGLKSDRPDQCLTIAAWEQLLAQQTADIHRLQNSAALNPADIGRALLTLAYQQWQQGYRPSWQEVLPHYG